MTMTEEHKRKLIAIAAAMFRGDQMPDEYMEMPKSALARQQCNEWARVKLVNETHTT